MLLIKLILDTKQINLNLFGNAYNGNLTSGIWSQNGILLVFDILSQKIK